MTIYFYSKTDAHSWPSNFSPHGPPSFARVSCVREVSAHHPEWGVRVSLGRLGLGLVPQFRDTGRFHRRALTKPASCIRWGRPMHVARCAKTGAGLPAVGQWDESGCPPKECFRRPRSARRLIIAPVCGTATCSRPADRVAIGACTRTPPPNPAGAIDTASLAGCRGASDLASAGLRRARGWDRYQSGMERTAAPASSLRPT